MPQNDCSCEDNRESGESPERSGHCEAGSDVICRRFSKAVIAWEIHVRRFGKALICKSGNLLGELVKSFRRK